MTMIMLNGFSNAVSDGGMEVVHRRQWVMVAELRGRRGAYIDGSEAWATRMKSLRCVGYGRGRAYAPLLPNSRLRAIHVVPPDVSRHMQLLRRSRGLFFKALHEVTLAETLWSYRSRRYVSRSAQRGKKQERHLEGLSGVRRLRWCQRTRECQESRHRAESRRCCAIFLTSSLSYLLAAGLAALVSVLPNPGLGGRQCALSVALHSQRPLRGRISSPYP